MNNNLVCIIFHLCIISMYTTVITIIETTTKNKVKVQTDMQIVLFWHIIVLIKEKHSKTRYSIIIKIEKTKK